MSKELYDISIQLESLVVAANPDETFNLIRIGDKIEYIEKINRLIQATPLTEPRLVQIGDNHPEAIMKINDAIKSMGDL